jgi:hypothetical protein
MRNTLQTPFWRAVYDAMPEIARRRALANIERAEHFDLAFDAVVAAASKAKKALADLFTTHKPRSAH